MISLLLCCEQATGPQCILLQAAVALFNLARNVYIQKILLILGSPKKSKLTSIPKGQQLSKMLA
jgi:hypothetical protein